MLLTRIVIVKLTQTVDYIHETLAISDMLHDAIVDVQDS